MDAINSGDVSRIAALMTEDHRFTDSMGHEVVGRAAMATGWTGYLAMFPDYRISVDQRFDSGNRIALFGHARATHRASGREVRMRAAWLGLVRDGLVAEWSVFADNEPARAALEGR